MAKRRFTITAAVEREIGVLAETEEEALEKVMTKVPDSWKNGGLKFISSSSSRLLELARSRH